MENGNFSMSNPFQKIEVENSNDFTLARIESQFNDVTSEIELGADLNFYTDDALQLMRLIHSYDDRRRRRERKRFFNSFMQMIELLKQGI